MIKKRISLLLLFFIAICALAVFVCLQTVAAFGVRAAETAGQETVNDFYCRRFDVYPLTEDEASITDPVGKSAVAENGELLLAQVGTYNIVYASGRVERVHVYSYLPETVFTLSENLEREYAAGDYLYIPVATATNEIETTDNCFVLVEKDGAEYCSYDSYTEEKRLDLSSAGEYEVTYGYLDVFGYITTQTYSFTVADKPVIVLPDISVFYLGEEYPMDAYAYAGGAEYAATCRVTDPLGKRAVVQTISADTIGEYVLEFTATVDGQELVRSCTIPCVEKPERLFQGDKFTVRQRSDVPLFPYSLQEGTGVELVGFASGAEFEYIHSVDMNGLTADENMISFQAASGDGYGALNAVEVTVTDAYDENNSFSVFFWQCPWVANYVYASVGYRGQYAGVCNEWYDGKEHYNELRYDYYLYPEYCYGAILMNHSLTGQGLTRLNDLSVQFDYASGKVYVTNKEGRYLLRDLGDPAHVGEGNEFEGFTYGKANITITLHEMLGRNAGVVVYELMGETLSGQTLADGTGPDVVLELPGEDMADLPSGVAGYAYDLPAVYATDNFSYIRSQEIVAKLNGAEQDGLIRDGKFYPNTAGEYEIIYRVTDSFGNVTQKILPVTVNENTTPIVISDSVRDEVLLGKKYQTPLIEASGGSGTLQIETEYYFCGERIYPDETDRILIDEYGELEIRANVTDFLGNTESKTFTYMLASEEPVVETGVIPKLVQRGETFEIPEFAVKLYRSGEWQTASVTVTVNSQPVSGSYTVGDEEELLLKYSISESGTEREWEYSIAVCESSSLTDFFIDSGARDGVCDEDGTHFLLNVGETLAYSYPLSDSDLLFRFSLDPQSGARFSVSLADSVDTAQSIVFTFFADGSETRMSVNGQSKTYKIPTAFSGGLFYLYYDKATHSIKDAGGKIVCTIDRTLSGVMFDGFTSSAVWVSMSAADAPTEVNIQQLSNQGFTSFAYRNGDMQGPVIGLEETLSNQMTVRIGETIVLPKAKAFDVLSDGATVSVDVFAPDGSAVAENMPVAEAFSFVCEQYGQYRITYYGEDMYGNRTQKSFSVRVRDEQAPVIQCDFRPPESVAVGEELKLPVFSVKDNLDAEVETALFVVDVHGKFHLIGQGSKYMFTEKGEYRIVLYARDSVMNVAQRDYVIKVV